jgi:molybdopterin molybdotransferase
MLELEQAVAQILATIPSPAVETIPLSEACGRVLADRIESPVDLPLFDNSTMDGYAVQAGDLARTTSESPTRLRLIGRAAAGNPFAGEVAPGTCVRVFTGSALPRGADAVVMQEDTRVETSPSGEVLFLVPVEPGENVRPRGEDVRQGVLIGTAGEVLGFGRISLLAAVGLPKVRVGRQPRVGLLATGSELREPGEALRPGQIYESNRTALAALVRQAGGLPIVFPLVEDTLEATRGALTEALRQCDVVLTSGGVSVGEMDFIKRALEDIGGSLEFWKVAIRPGRPFVFGRQAEKLLFGLPGNPVSALVTFLLLVRPALLKWQGAVDVFLPTQPAVLAEPLANPEGRRHFLRVRVDKSGMVRSAGAQASHILSSMAAADALLDVPPRTGLPAGVPVLVRSLVV